MKGKRVCVYSYERGFVRVTPSMCVFGVRVVHFRIRKCVRFLV